MYGRRSCWNGPSCSFLARGKCKFYHPPSHSQNRQQRNQFSFNNHVQVYDEEEDDYFGNNFQFQEEEEDDYYGNHFSFQEEEEDDYFYTQQRRRRPVQQPRRTTTFGFGNSISALLELNKKKKKEEEEAKLKREQQILLKMFSQKKQEKQKPITKGVGENGELWVEFKSLSLKNNNKEWFFNHCRHFEVGRSTNRDIYQQCPICFEDIKLMDKMTLLYCNHSFHTSCLEKWLKEKNNCPMCRKDYRDHEDFRKYDRQYKKKIQTTRSLSEIDTLMNLLNTLGLRMGQI